MCIYNIAIVAHSCQPFFFIACVYVPELVHTSFTYNTTECPVKWLLVSLPDPISPLILLRDCALIRAGV